MTVSSETNTVSYSGNGSTTEFPVTFKFYEITVLEVTSAGVVTAKTEGAHYTVTGGAGSTGTVTMGTAPASGVTLRIRRTTARSQLIDYVESDAFFAATHEEGLDRLVMQLHELGQGVSYNSTLGAESGSLSSAAAVARYVRIGNIIFFRLRIGITTNGDADGYVTATLPAAAEGAFGSLTGTGRTDNEVPLTFASISTTVIAIKTAADQSYPGGDGEILNVSGWFIAS